MQKESDKAHRIRTRAYEIWEKEGRPHGQDQAHWFAAESELGLPSRAAAAAKRATTSSVRARGTEPARRTRRKSKPEENA